MSRPDGSEDYNANPGVIEIYSVFGSVVQCISYVETKQASLGSITPD